MPIQERDLERFRSMGDPEADTALVDILGRLAKEDPPLYLKDVLKALGKWDPSRSAWELPGPIAEYVSLPFDNLPAWIDRARVERAQAAYTERHLSGATVVLAAYSLPILYIHPEISLTLATTAQLLLYVRRRYQDTRDFTEAVMKPGSLEPCRPGHLWIRRVRLTHAAARLMIRSKPQTSFDLAEMQVRMLGRVEDKMPLDQVELALVLQTFAWVLVEGLREMGWRMRGGEPADHIHAWSAIGAMMGIDEALLPRGANELPEAKNLFVLIRNHCLRAGDPLGADPDDKHDTRLAGRLLIAAWITFLVQVQRENTPEKLRCLLKAIPRLDEALQQLPRILIRRLCGNEAARYLRIGHAGWFDRIACWVAMVLFDLRKSAARFDEPPSDVLSGALL